MQELKVLFLCTGNSCRSQMAEGWTRHLKAGVDVSGQRSKLMSEIAEIEFDYVVTVCDSAREQRPLFPGKCRVVHVGFDDPPNLGRNAATAEEALKHYRRVRDEIKEFVGRLPEYLTDIEEDK